MTLSVRITRRRLIVVGLLAVAISASAAFAFLVVGTGNSGRGAIDAAHVSPTFTRPGGNTGTSCQAGGNCSLLVTVNNPNAFPLVLTAVDYGSQSFVVEKPVGTPNAACPVSNFTKLNPTGLSVAIPAGGPNDIIIPGAYSLAANAPIDCAGSTVQLGTGLGGSTTSYTTRPAP